MPAKKRGAVEALQVIENSEWRIGRFWSKTNGPLLAGSETNK